MPTNDERREVAARIRALREHAWDESSVFDLLGCAVEECGLDDADQLFAHLADLIEPEERTCKRGVEMFSHAYPNEIVCDSDCVSTYVFPLTCGHEVELLKNEWPNYCPVCGAKVVDNHA